MKTVEIIDTTPDAHFLESLRNTRIHYPEALSELVDNAFDQAATRVVITMEQKCITVEDDGNGCDDLTAMLSYGKHRRTKDTALGRYGVGLKDAACGLGSLLTIDTVCGGVRRTCTMDWKNRNPNFKERAEKEETTNENGTTIRISQLYSRCWNVAAICNRLAYNFAPALKDDRQIIIKTGGEEIVLAPWMPPSMTDVIQVTMNEEEDDPDSRGYRLQAGIVEGYEGDPFIFAYEHRILFGSSEPCGDLRGSTRFFAYVELLGKWPLLKHKDGISSREAEEWLIESLKEDCRHLLERLQKEGEAIELKDVESILGDLMGARVGRAARPNNGNEKGTVEPRNTNRTVTEAEAIHEDPNREVKERGKRAKRRGVTLGYDSYSDGSIGRVDRSSYRTSVTLNEKHLYVAECRKTGDRKQLAGICIALVSAHRAFNRGVGQKRFYNVDDDYSEFVKSYSAWMAHLVEKASESASA